jgi:hypothetical protein
MAAQLAASQEGLSSVSKYVSTCHLSIYIYIYIYMIYLAVQAAERA